MTDHQNVELTDHVGSIRAKLALLKSRTYAGMRVFSGTDAVWLMEQLDAALTDNVTLAEMVAHLQARIEALEEEKEQSLRFLKNAISRFKYDVRLANGNKETIRACSEECRRLELEILSSLS